MYSMILGGVTPGRYWMDSATNVGLEGQSEPMFNLAALTATAMAAAQAWQGNQGYPAYGGQNGGYPSYNTGNGGGGSVWMRESGGGAYGTGVGTASDGCTYVMSGSYSADFCP